MGDVAVTGELRIVRLIEAVLDGCGDISDRQRVANVRRALAAARAGEHVPQPFRARRGSMTVDAERDAA